MDRMPIGTPIVGLFPAHQAKTAMDRRIHLFHAVVRQFARTGPEAAPVEGEELFAFHHAVLCQAAFSGPNSDLERIGFGRKCGADRGDDGGQVAPVADIILDDQCRSPVRLFASPPPTPPSKSRLS